MTGLFCSPWSGSIDFLGSSRQWTETESAGSFPRSRRFSHLGGRARRRPTCLLYTGLGHRVRRQAELDDPTVWHHGPRWRKGIRCIHYAENNQLRQYMAPAFFVFLHDLHTFDLCYLLHLGFCPMQPATSIVDLCARGYLLGPQSSLRLCNIHCEYGPLIAFDESKYQATLMTSHRL